MDKITKQTLYPKMSVTDTDGKYADADVIRNQGNAC